MGQLLSRRVSANRARVHEKSAGIHCRHCVGLVYGKCRASVGHDRAGVAEKSNGARGGVGAVGRLEISRPWFAGETMSAFIEFAVPTSWCGDMPLEPQMKFLPPEAPLELYKEGFGDDDVLQRKKVGRALSDLVERIDDPLVIALDGRWGTGKTHFLKRWVGAHQFENGGLARTVYFDAFQHDYQTDPLPAILAAVLERMPEEAVSKVSKLKEAAYRLSPAFLRLGVAAVTAGVSEVTGPLADAVLSAASNEAKNEVARYWAKQEGRKLALEELRDALRQLASEVKEEGEEGAALVVVVDELDRCRPEFALELLEIIKHVFSVPRVHFVLGTNLGVLQNAVAVRHGSAIDAEAYLRKFLDITLSLPSEIGPSDLERVQITAVYLDHLMDSMGTPMHLRKVLSDELQSVQRGNSVSMRDLSKIVSGIALLSNDALKNSALRRETWMPGWLNVAVGMLVAHTVAPRVYKEMVTCALQDSDLLAYYGVTASDLVERRGSVTNPDYEFTTFWRVTTWRFLLSNGQIDSAPDRYSELVSQQFEQGGRVREPASIPKRIAREWLNLFELARD